jgi:hypothetical protein
MSSDELAREYLEKIERQHGAQATGPFVLVRDASERVPHFFAGTRLRNGRFCPLFSATPGLAKCFGDDLLANKWASFFGGLHIMPAPQEAQSRVEIEEPPQLPW